MSRYFSFERLWDVIPKLNKYLPVTLEVVLIALVVGTILGLLVAVIQVYKVPFFAKFFRVYTVILRSIPFIVLLFLVYYYVPFLVKILFGQNIESWDKIIFIEIAFALNEVAFMGEIFRGAFESVPKLQSEAAYAVGLTKLQTFRRIILPQAIKVAIPMYGTNVVWIFASSSVTYMFGLLDFLGKTKTIAARTGHVLEAYIYVAFVYAIISIGIECFFRFVDKKYTFGA